MLDVLFFWGCRSKEWLHTTLDLMCKQINNNFHICFLGFNWSNTDHLLSSKKREPLCKDRRDPRRWVFSTYSFSYPTSVLCHFPYKRLIKTLLFVHVEGQKHFSEVYFIIFHENPYSQLNKAETSEFERIVEATEEAILARKTAETWCCRAPNAVFLRSMTTRTATWDGSLEWCCACGMARLHSNNVSESSGLCLRWEGSKSQPRKLWWVLHLVSIAKNAYMTVHTLPFYFPNCLSPNLCNLYPIAIRSILKVPTNFSFANN